MHLGGGASGSGAHVRIFLPSSYLLRTSTRKLHCKEKAMLILISENIPRLHLEVIAKLRQCIIVITLNLTICPAKHRGIGNSGLIRNLFPCDLSPFALFLLRFDFV